METFNPIVCNAVQVFAWPRAMDATTEPLVGEIVNVPSLFATELTAPLPVPHAAPVLLIAPVVPICKQ
jgi:hypothetical protein